MENLMVAFQAVTPMCLMIGVGCLVRYGKMMDESAVRQANSMAYRIFMGLLMFYNIYTADLGVAMNGRLVGFCCVGLMIEFAVGMWIVRKMEKRPGSQGVMLLSFIRTNSALIGVALATSVFGEGNIGEITILVSVVVPLSNVLSVVAFETVRGGQIHPGKLVMGILKNPLILGVLLALVLVIPGIRLPGVAESTIHSIASASSPLVQVLLGASLDFSRFRLKDRNVVFCLIMRLLVFPAVFVSLGMAMGFRGVPLMGIMLIFGCPMAANSFTMAVEMDGDTDLAGELVLLTTALSCVTLFGWIFLLKTLGMF